jgi:hypothetical protein
LADWKDDIGYTQLVNSLTVAGVPVPDGNGVPISIVESTSPISSGARSYKPDPSNVEFTAGSDPLGEAVNFIDASNNTCTGGPCTGFSTHARGMTQTILGNAAGLNPTANTVTLYEANHFLSTVLKAPSGGTPSVQSFRVQNFSWVGTFENVNDDVSALRRFDHMINRDNLTAVVGVNNLSTTVLPNLLAHSYNAIAAGRTDGNHSTGLTTISSYGPGRSKPDIVAPQTTASLATATVSSAATLLHGVVAGTDAAESEVMKAILMAGATKTEFTSWTRTASQPLDDTSGAGELNVFNSYLMTQGGQYAGSTLEPTVVGSHGWDYGNALPGVGNELKYQFVVPTGKTAPDLSILLTWNVDVPGGFTGQSLANFDMTLTDSLGQTVDQSLSTVDNVEHIYLTNLVAGDYTLTISTDTARDFGLAWRMSTLSDIATADFDADGDVDGRDFLTWQRGFGKLINAGLADGDADGDGDVDAADLTIFQAQFIPGVIDPPPLVLAAVPEPGSALLLASGLLAFALKRQR